MAHAHESNMKRIWTVFGILSVITTVEVYFGITKPEALFLGTFLRMSLLNWLFIILTIVKAYYIMWAFMHLEGEKKSLRWSVVAPLVFLILYLCFIILIEADYIFEVFKNSHYKWIFFYLCISKFKFSVVKKYIVLTVLFVLPIVAYMFFATASHNSLFLPVISKNHSELPSQFVSLNGEKVVLDKNITVLGFPGSNIDEVKANLFNLNQKIYNKYEGFKDFQMVMILPDGNQDKIKAIMLEFRRLSNDLKNWHFLFGKPEAIQTYFNTFNFKNKLDSYTATSFVYIIDKEKNLRGRKGQKIKGKVEYRECYNTISAAELHNEMSDDVKILLREYRLALKKNKRKDDFRDKIEQEVIKK